MVTHTPLMDRLTELMARGPVLFDGAMGTELFARGVAGGRCLEELNLTEPVIVSGVHRDYIAAGADVIETNTFGANRFGLGEHYLEHRVRDVNRAGVRLAVEARHASGRPVLVAGSIGPLGRPIEPVGAIKRTSAERVFREQVEALAGGGADLLVFETFTALGELELAIRVAREVAPELPVVASVSFDDEANPQAAAAALVAVTAPLGVLATGVNCGSGPQPALNVARHLVAAGAGAVGAWPNAGLPERVGGRLVYTVGPEYFAEYAAQMVAEGVGIVGGCCGTGPAHIAATRARLAEAAAGPVAPPLRASRPDPEARAPVPGSRLERDLARGRFVISVELTPPRGIDPAAMLAGARLLKEAGVDYANVTDSAMARLRMGVISCAALVQQQVGLETIAHFTCRDRNVMAIQSELIGAHALGIRNLLALRGDPPRVGDYPNATPVWDVNAVGLITIVSNLNRGLDANGTPIGDHAAFHVGAAVNPGADDLGRELRLLRRKVAAGAAFVVTNPIYDPAALQRLREIREEVDVPVLVGVLPLRSLRQAEYLHHEVPGITVPRHLLDRLERAGDRAPELGVELAVGFLEEACGHVQGAYVIPSAGRYQLAGQVVSRVRDVVGSRRSG
ncbi:MAG TPA: bifunctional homocysteine S-methyltransferase/methylenetetrahydrofolate reductase [Candidatus Dormibacteraeota bacterium]|nr:bifunctional homocysteine S-methyltransferase/methylenetetrahydrofolate reductase [Candidatus Dormibacteraeota bacterium]